MEQYLRPERKSMDEYLIEMDENMKLYRKNGIPFYGYLWTHRQTRQQGAGLMRLDGVPAESIRRVSDHKKVKWGRLPSEKSRLIGPTTIIKATVKGVADMKRLVKKLQSDPHYEVFVYQG